VKKRSVPIPKKEGADTAEQVGWMGICIEKDEKERKKEEAGEVCVGQEERKKSLNPVFCVKKNPFRGGRSY